MPINNPLNAEDSQVTGGEERHIKLSIGSQLFTMPVQIDCSKTPEVNHRNQEQLNVAYRNAMIQRLFWALKITLASASVMAAIGIFAAMSFVSAPWALVTLFIVGIIDSTLAIVMMVKFIGTLNYKLDKANKELSNEYLKEFVHHINSNNIERALQRLENALDCLSTDNQKQLLDILPYDKLEFTFKKKSHRKHLRELEMIINGTWTLPYSVKEMEARSVYYNLLHVATGLNRPRLLKKIIGNYKLKINDLDSVGNSARFVADYAAHKHRFFKKVAKIIKENDGSSKNEISALAINKTKDNNDIYVDEKHIKCELTTQQTIIESTTEGVRLHYFIPILVLFDELSDKNPNKVLAALTKALKTYKHNNEARWFISAKLILCSKQYALSNDKVDFFDYLTPNSLVIQDPKNKKTLCTLFHVAATTQSNTLYTLINYCQNNNLEVEKLINLTNCKKETPLHIAVKKGDCEMIKMLMYNGADLFLTNALGSPLLYAAYFNNIQALKTIIDYVNMNFNPEKKESFQLAKAVRNKAIAIHYAIKNGNLEMVKMLTEEGYSYHINYCINDSFAKALGGCSALHIAVENGHLDIVEYLCKNGAKVNIGDLDNLKNPIHIALEKGNKAIFNCLIKHTSNIKLNASNKQKEPCLLPALTAHYDETILKHLEEKDEYGIQFKEQCEIWLVYAVQRTFDTKNFDNDSKEYVNARLLFDKALNECIRTKSELIYALSHAVHLSMEYELKTMLKLAPPEFDYNMVNHENQETLLTLAIKRSKNNGPVIAQYLLEKGAKPNISNGKMELPLYLAIKNNQSTEIADYILSQYNIGPIINLDIKDTDGKSALHHIASCTNQNAVEVVIKHEFEHNHGATLLVQDHKNKTPIMSFLERIVCKKILQESLSYPKSTTNQNQFPTPQESSCFIIKLSEIYHSFLANCQDAELQKQITNNVLAAIELKNQEGETPLLYALRKLSYDDPAIRALILLGANENAIDNKGIGAELMEKQYCTKLKATLHGTNFEDTQSIDSSTVVVNADFEDTQSIDSSTVVVNAEITSYNHQDLAHGAIGLC